MDNLIKVKNISKRYRKGLTRTSLPTIFSRLITNSLKRIPDNESKDQYFWALSQVNFELKKGQSLALIGPNGAGKTTLLKLLANITKPTSGQIEINGRLSALIELGAGFHPDLTGRENIYLNGTILGIKKKDIDRLYNKIVEFSEIGDFIETPLKRYSSGMAVRLGFSVAACINPDILLVDEVLAVGDSSFRQKCIDRIHELLEKGTSIVFVSHNLWLVQSVCETGIYIDHGKVKFMGKITEVIEAYDKDINEQRAMQLEVNDSNPINLDYEVEITNIEILGKNGVVIDEIPNDQPIEIKIHYLAYNDIGAVNFVIRVIRSDGLTCFMLRTKIDNIQFFIKRGKGVLSVIIDPVQLYGGNYYVHALIRDANDVGSITNKGSNWFCVKGALLSSESMDGVFEPNRRWEHIQL